MLGSLRHFASELSLTPYQVAVLLCAGSQLSLRPAEHEGRESNPFAIAPHEVATIREAELQVIGAHLLKGHVVALNKGSIHAWSVGPGKSRGEQKKDGQSKESQHFCVLSFSLSTALFVEEMLPQARRFLPFTGKKSGRLSSFDRCS